jgi:hypothetical protein
MQLGDEYARQLFNLGRSRGSPHRFMKPRRLSRTNPELRHKRQMFRGIVAILWLIYATQLPRRLQCVDRVYGQELDQLRTKWPVCRETSPVL